jgi:hypothetical protein
MAEPKWGAGALPAFIRQGAKELGHYLKAFPDAAPQIEETGTLLNPTQAEIMEAKRSESSITGRLQEAQERSQTQRDDRSKDLERD